MNTSTAEKEQYSLDDEIARARKNISGLEEKLRVVDNELQGFVDQKQQHHLLNTICDSLHQLQALGGSHLFWREHPAPDDTEGFLNGGRALASAFEEKISDIERRRAALREAIEEEWLRIDLLNEEIAELQEEEEARKHEFVVEREITNLPFRPAILPWNQDDEDEKRFRKVLLISLLIALSFGTIMSIWRLPPPEQTPVVEVPDRIVQLAKQSLPPPPPVKLPEKQPDQKEEKSAEKSASATSKATAAETKAARAKAEGSGVLAFKNSFSELMDVAPAGKLGVNAQVSNHGQASVGQAQRSLVVAQAESGSGGISTAALSRDVGGGGAGKRIGGVQFTRVESAFGTAGNVKGAGSDRPLSSGPGPSRTDEEIQIVFDRYKATLYRIYNHELRNDPTLRGKMILRITIEPSGEVSACRIDSTDLNSRALSAEIVDRVRKFNFGPKNGVPRITILYPIDFLPATG